MITITETLYKKMPDDIKACFNQLPNPSSEEVRECFPESNGSQTTKVGKTYGETDGRSYLQTKPHGVNINDKGSASRFFKSILYYPKASKSERNKGMDNIYILKDNTPNEVITEIQNILAIN
jgi:hypothetical protein